MSYCYVLSENQARDITIALNHPSCPEGLQICARVVFRLYYQRGDMPAHSVACRALAAVAREFWQGRAA